MLLPLSLHLPRAHMRTLAAALLASLVGCSALPTPPQQVARYDLGAPPALQTTAAAPAQAVAVAAMRAPLQVEGSTALNYRLAYATDQAQMLHAYAQARWSLPPAQLVQQRLREHLGQGGRAVLSAEPGEIPASVRGYQAWVVHWSLEEFSHVFTSAQDSVGWVRVRATLVDPAPQGDVLLAQRVFEVRQPAAQANAQSGVQALSQAVDVVGVEMQQWLAQVSVRQTSKQTHTPSATQAQPLVAP